MTKGIISFLACLVLVGCDDQQVQDKVTEVMQHGAVQSYMDCTGKVEPPICGNGDFLTIKRSTFQDGSVLQEVDFRPNTRHSLYSPRGISDTLFFEHVTRLCSGCYGVEIDLVEDKYEITIPSGNNCPSGETFVVDLLDSGTPIENEMLCTGFNMNL